MHSSIPRLIYISEASFFAIATAAVVLSVLTLATLGDVTQFGFACVALFKGFQTKYALLETEICKL
jgi:hypothetical protein